MNSTLVPPVKTETHVSEVSVQQTINQLIDDMMASLPNVKHLSSAERRGMIARYTSVLEGNFIYWMTATFMAAKSEVARTIIIDNLNEEIRDAHPHMMRKFAAGAHAYPESSDAFAVHDDLTSMRLFMGRMDGAKSILAMAFFEGFIQRFMSYLASLAVEQGSAELEYTDVHGVCDIEHTAGLFRAYSEETSASPAAPGTDIFEGVYLLRDLLRTIIFGQVYSIAV
jgi:hypothetical protein